MRTLTMVTIRPIVTRESMQVLRVMAESLFWHLGYVQVCFVGCCH